MFEKFVFFEISVDCLASGASPSYFRIDLNNMTKVMLKLFIFKFLRQRLHVCVFLSFLFCGSDVSASMLLFLWPCFVMKLGALPWSSCDGFVTASRTENRERFKNEHPWGVRFKPCPAHPFLRNFLSRTIRGDAAMWFWTREMWLKMVLCPGPTKHTPAQPKTDTQNVTQTGPADGPNFWSLGRA